MYLITEMAQLIPTVDIITNNSKHLLNVPVYPAYEYCVCMIPFIPHKHPFIPAYKRINI